jgi:hypothetical protein
MLDVGSVVAHLWGELAGKLMEHRNGQHAAAGVRCEVLYCSLLFAAWSCCQPGCAFSCVAACPPECLSHIKLRVLQCVLLLPLLRCCRQVCCQLPGYKRKRRAAAQRQR